VKQAAFLWIIALQDFSIYHDDDLEKGDSIRFRVSPPTTSSNAKLHPAFIHHTMLLLITQIIELDF
jgi:hypothetical protein